jgi:nucleoside-diphosphate-sugar epimerase
MGFLGGSVVRELLDRGHCVTVMDRRASQKECDRLFGVGTVQARAGDVLDCDSLELVFRGAQEVYHFAGRLGTSELNDDMIGAIEANVSGAVNVFEAARRASVPVVFYPSKPNVWLNTYTITKYAAEQFARLYSERGLRVCLLRYFNAFGPGQAVGPIRKIIPTFAWYAMRGRALPVYGDGNQTVDLIHSADLARVTVEFVRAQTWSGPVDLGRGVALTVNEVAVAVNSYFTNTSGIEYLPMRPGETPGTTLVADLVPLEKILGPLTFKDWAGTLGDTLAWYEHRYGPAGDGDSVSATLSSP